MKKTFFAVAAAAALFIGLVLVAPTAYADTLPNGYSVTCTPNGHNDAVCNISGCPRVQGDEAGDVVHTRINGMQDELSKGCNSAATTTIENISPGGFTMSIQGCRKHTLPGASDDCGSWSDYKYTPPAPVAPNAPPPNGQNGAPPNNAPPVNCPAGSVSATVPAGQRCQAGAPVSCPAGSVSATVPAGQQCQAAPPPTNAVAFNFQKNGLQINAIIVNKSSVAGQCHYHAVNTNGIIPDRTDDFPIGANATVTRTYPAPPPLAKFHATVTCTGDFNGKSDEFGNTSADVTG